VWRWLVILTSLAAGLIAYGVRPGRRTLTNGPRQESLDEPERESEQPKPMNAMTKAELLEQAKQLKISGRSKMTKEELFEAIHGDPRRSRATGHPAAAVGATMIPRKSRARERKIDRNQ